MKGLFLARSRGAKGSWQFGGPYFSGNPVYAIAYDDRAGRTRLWAVGALAWRDRLRLSYL